MAGFDIYSSGSFPPCVAMEPMAGADRAARFAGGTVSGAPTSGEFRPGDFVVAQDGQIWICTSGGAPGSWHQAGV